MRPRYAVLVVLPLLAACSVADTSAPESSSLSSLGVTTSKAAPTARPAGGRCDTEVTLLPPMAGDPANYLRMHMTYLCQLKHLGRTTASAEQLAILTSPNTGTASNTTTYTAANGDVLYATFSGTFSSVGPDLEFSGEEIITGGTGRFAGATGSTSVTGTASFATTTGQFTTVGSITY